MKQINLTQGKIALVDDEDYEWLNKWKWNCHKQKNGSLRAVRSDKANNTSIIMAREIMDAGTGYFVDHKDHNGLNNQKSNLRVCTQSQNNFNKKSAKKSTSKYLGVCWDRENKKWCASITDCRLAMLIFC